MKVRLYRDHSHIALCNVHYLGILGMFIIADPLLLPKNTLIEAEFVDDANQSGTTRRFPAVVTKRNLDGVGLTFKDMDKQSNQDLLTILSTPTNTNSSE